MHIFNKISKSILTFQYSIFFVRSIFSYIYFQLRCLVKNQQSTKKNIINNNNNPEY